MVYSNFFTSYNEASHSLGDDCNLDAYSSERWISRLEDFNKTILSFSYTFDENQLPRSSSLPLFLTANSYVSSILDLGGGGGWLGLYIKKSYKQVKEYDIIEIDSVKNHFAKFLNPYGIHYASDLNLQRYQILYTNSCIQYMPSLDFLLKCIESSTPNYLIFDDMYLSRKDQFFCHQKYYDKVMVMSFISFHQLKESLSSLGYQLSFADIYRDPILGKNEVLPFEDSVLESWRPKHRYTLIFEQK